MRDTTDKRPDGRSNRVNNPVTICVEPDCEKEIKGGWALHCNAHYRRRWSAGLPTLFHEDKPAPKGRYINNKTGYVSIKEPSHPLASKGGYLYEHRKVAYDKYGPGPNPCHWCGTMLTWTQTDVDHVDWNKENNSAENLVVSCEHCNSKRHEPKAPASPNLLLKAIKQRAD